ncbi:hypothetical protein EV361DRAFT_889050 [Lentinula raphanica]|nr:hypothetical protein EV361DRAFT_889050 [Lentinula raphanica]
MSKSLPAWASVQGTSQPWLMLLCTPIHPTSSSPTLIRPFPRFTNSMNQPGPTLSNNYSKVPVRNLTTTTKQPAAPPGDSKGTFYSYISLGDARFDSIFSSKCLQPAPGFYANQVLVSCRCVP